MIEKQDGFTSHAGGERFYRSWLPEPGTERQMACTVVVCHGYAEHSGRYQGLAEILTSLGVPVYGPDHYGHGKSDGNRAVVPRFELFAEDLHQLVDTIRTEGPQGEKIVLIGHSMGGAIVTVASLLFPNIADAIILSGAAIRNEGGASAPLRFLARIIGTIAPEVKVKPFDIEGISRDPEVVDRYLKDPLVYTDSMKAGMGKQMLRVSRIAPDERLRNINIPALILHGGEDRLVDPRCSNILNRELGSKDKTLKIFPGLYHEIFNEPEKQEVFETVSTWLLSRFPAV